MSDPATQFTPKSTQRRDGKWVWIGFYGVILIAFGIMVGIGIDRSGSAPSAEGLRNDRFTHLAQTGEAQSMLDQHQAMMEQMRVDATPAMLQIMDNDPMWQIMRNGEFAEMMSDQQAQIDRMLGRGAP